MIVKAGMCPKCGFDLYFYYDPILFTVFGESPSPVFFYKDVEVFHCRKPSRAKLKLRYDKSASGEWVMSGVEVNKISIKSDIAPGEEIVIEPGVVRISEILESRSKNFRGPRLSITSGG